MDIQQLSKTTNNIYYREDFMAFLEQHLGYIEQQGVTLVTITETNAYKHEGNFYGILDELNIPNDFHYITMRINGFRNSNHYDGNDVNLKIPNFSIVEQLKNQYLTLKN